MGEGKHLEQNEKLESYLLWLHIEDFATFFGKDDNIFLCPKISSISCDTVNYLGFIWIQNSGLELHSDQDCRVCGSIQFLK